ncbi:transposase [Streptomyces sp. SID9124]|uniref:transposase n=1 Tax=Streptomyces sp. SID9124 TaxID=2706108 RepID=UPI0013DFBF13|nr:hypothetical protein [Streptomyces sp. SID9124]
MPPNSSRGNEGWMLATNLAADLDAWLRLLALHDQDELTDAEPDTMRFRLYHQPGRLTHHARRRYLRLDPTWPWTSAFTLAWTRITDLAAVT